MGFNRRHFLKILGGSAATIPFISFGRRPKPKLGVALLGLGRYSTSVLAPALQLTEYCELKGIITGSPEKVANWQRRYTIADANVYSYDNMSQVANNTDIDVIYVVTPTATHLQFAVAAAKAGKHVWCEKPMAMSVAECQSMIDACAKNGVKLSIGYRMQHEPNTRTFAAYRQTKPFGNIKAISSYAGYAGGPADKNYWRMQRKMGGGALYDMGVYSINGARFMTGSEPVAVKARIETSAAFNDVDTSAYMTLKFANGLQADCGTSVVKAFNHLDVNCDNGWYKLKPMQSYSGVVGETSSGLVLSAFEGNQQAKQMDDDALAIMQNALVLVPGQEGMNDIRVVQAALKSAQTQQQFVDLA